VTPDQLVVESLTVQSLPRQLRAAAIARVREVVAPGGTLLVIAAGDLKLIRLEDFRDPDAHR
jgi:hypothetical protein